MNYNSPNNCAQNFPPQFTNSNNLVSALSSSIQEMANMMLQSIYKEAQKKVLLDLLCRKNEVNIPQQNTTIEQVPIRAPQDNYSSIDILHGGVGEEDNRDFYQEYYMAKADYGLNIQDNLSHSTASESAEEIKPSVCRNYNRKEKSLGELSRKFLTMFGRTDNCVISLDMLTKELDVERRRVYDIINILESLGVVYRKGKNNYQWSGFQPIQQTISKLEVRSEMKLEGYSEDGSPFEDSVDQRLAHKKEKSLAFLSGSFIKLFFYWKKTFSLEEAAWKLSPIKADENKVKTKIRRLYDIANVFSSLGIIKKVCLEHKKPAFTWIGVEGLEEFIRKLNASASKQTLPKDRAVNKTHKLAQPDGCYENPALLNIELNNNTQVNFQQTSSTGGLLDQFLNSLMDPRQNETHPNGFPSVSSYPQNIEQVGFPAPTMTHQGYPQNYRNDPEIHDDFGEYNAPVDRRVNRIHGGPCSINVKRVMPQCYNGMDPRALKKVHTNMQTIRENREIPAGCYPYNFTPNWGNCTGSHVHCAKDLGSLQ